ncbi:MAG: hypothetical protein ABIT20_05290 [Gemmatimonadaceae bacterium]
MPDRTLYGTTRVRTSVRRLALMAVGVLAIACGDAGTGPGAGQPTTPVATYQLTTVQGKALPYRLFSDVNYSVDVAKATLTLSVDGSFLAAFVSEERVENHLSVYTDTTTGGWTQTGTSITFTASDDTKQKGTWSGKTISLVDTTGVAPVTYVYTAP